MMSQTPHEIEGRSGVPVVEREAAVCLRCGYQWFPRVENPARCPHCSSSLWNTERAQQLPGKPAPTRKGKMRGIAFNSETGRRAIKKRYAAEKAAELAEVSTNDPPHQSDD